MFFCGSLKLKTHVQIIRLRFMLNLLNENFSYIPILDKGVLLAPGDNSPDAPGEVGRPVILPTNMSVEMKKAVDDGWQKNAFNQYASDLISIHRSLPDPRDPW